MYSERTPAAHLLVYLFAVGLVIVSIVLAANTGSENLSTISVEGTKIISTLPDQVVIRLSVETEEDTAKDASSDNAKIMSKVLTALREEEISSYQIRTVYMNVYPVYDYDRSPAELEGYKAVHTIEIKSNKISSAGAYIDAAVEAGANVVNSVNFVLSEGYQNQLRAEALGEASSNAKMKATAIAKSIDVKLGDPVRITANTQYIPFIGMESSSIRKGEVPSDIQAGEIEFTVDVFIDFEIK